MLREHTAQMVRRRWTTRHVDADDERAFTLIELLVVVIIIGILSAIAIPVYLQQREKAFNTQAQSDARNLASAEFAVAADTGRFTTDLVLLGSAGGFRGSGNGDVTHGACVVNNGTRDEFVVGAKHASSNDVWVMTSDEGIVRIADAGTILDALQAIEPTC